MGRKPEVRRYFFYIMAGLPVQEVFGLYFQGSTGARFSGKSHSRPSPCPSGGTREEGEILDE